MSPSSWPVALPSTTIVRFDALEELDAPRAAGKGQTVVSCSMFAEMPSASSHFIGLAHRHLGGAEQDERDVGLARAELARRRDERARELAACAGASSFCAMRVVGVLARRAPAVLVVLVGVHDLLGADHAGQRARRDAAIGDARSARSRVTSPSACSSPRSTDDRRRVERRAASAVVREVRVAEEDDRRLQLVGEVERLPRELEGVGVVAGREDDARELALRGVDARSAGRTARSTWAGRSPARVA